MTMQNSVILITSDGMGHAEPALQKTLIEKYLGLLLTSADLPAVICFYTDGVRLVVEGSPVLSALRSLEEKGVRLVICSTCLAYFNLAGKTALGIVGGMGDILEAQSRADKVITL